MNLNSSHTTASSASGGEAAAADGSAFPMETSGEQQLARFCEATLALLQSNSENRSILASVLPSLAQIIGSQTPDAVEQLRHELRVWRSTTDQLKDLARIHCGDNASELVHKLDQTYSVGNSVIDALAALRSLQPPVAPLQPNADPLPDQGQDSSNGSPATIAADRQPDPVNQTGGRAAELLQQADKFQLDQNIEAAEPLYSAALVLDPELQPAYVGRGRVRLQRGAVDLALADFTRATALSPSDPLVPGMLGDAFVLSHRFAEAVDAYTRALVSNPGLTRLRYNRAVALRLAGDLERALTEFDALVEESPAHCPYYLNRGLIWFARRQLHLAAAEFKIALAHQPDSAEARERLHEVEGLLQTTGSAEVPAELPAKRPAEPAAKPAAEPAVLVETACIEPAPVNPGRAGRRKQSRKARRAAARVPRDVPPSDDDVAMQLLHDDEVPSVEMPGAAPPATDSIAAERRLAPAVAAPAVATLGAETVAEIPVLPPQVAFHTDADSVPDAETDPQSSMGADSTPGIVVEQPGSRLPRQTGSGLQGGSSMDGIEIPFHCPSCTRTSTVSLSQLQPGRILTCRHCRKCCTCRADGKLAAIVRDNSGHWKEEGASRRFTWNGTSQRYWVSGGLALAMLVCGVAFSPKLLGGWMRPEIPLQEDFEPRVRIFAWAWMRGDYRTMRRLTDSANHDALQNWYRQNQVPLADAPESLEDNVIPVVKTLVDKGGTRRMEVRFQGLTVGGAQVPPLPLEWKERGLDWLFNPLTDDGKTRRQE